MKKLTLNLETLTVESFAAADTQPSRGTVVGAEAMFTGPDQCMTVICGDSEIRACMILRRMIAGRRPPGLQTRR